MYIVEVETPDDYNEFIALSRREALMREEFERRAAEAIYGQDDRDNIHVKVSRYF